MNQTDIGPDLLATVNQIRSDLTAVLDGMDVGASIGYPPPMPALRAFQARIEALQAAMATEPQATLDCVTDLKERAWSVAEATAPEECAGGALLLDAAALLLKAAEPYIRTSMAAAWEKNLVASDYTGLVRLHAGITWITTILEEAMGGLL